MLIFLFDQSMARFVPFFISVAVIVAPPIVPVVAVIVPVMFASTAVNSPVDPDSVVFAVLAESYPIRLLAFNTIRAPLAAVWIVPPVIVPAVMLPMSALMADRFVTKILLATTKAVVPAVPAPAAVLYGPNLFAFDTKRIQ
jgi:hypothetical protein